MKRSIYLFVALCLVVSMMACSKKVVQQTASAYLDQDGNVVEAKIDLTGGWSVEFARGAFYLYDDKHTVNEEVVAIGMTLSQEVFEDYVAEAMKDAKRKEMQDGLVYHADQGKYIVNIDDFAYFLLTAEGDMDIEKICTRVALSIPE